MTAKNVTTILLQRLAGPVQINCLDQEPVLNLKWQMDLQWIDFTIVGNVWCILTTLYLILALNLL